MTDGMLNEILAIERQVEERLGAERAKAAAWVADRKAEIDRRAEEALSLARAETCRQGEQRCSAVRRESARRILDMRRHLRRLRELSDEALCQALRQRLPRVLGGGGHDHPDG